MSPDIRISISDDETFERLKRRKNELDLSWKEVVLRGLKKRTMPLEHLGIKDPIGKRALEIVDGLTITTPEAEEDIETTIDRLERGEDSILSFDFLNKSRCRIPLRIGLTTGKGGHKVKWQEVRRGKSTSHMNSFSEEEREEIAEKLGEGRKATLKMERGKIEYDVVPTISWTRDDSGFCCAKEVSVEEIDVQEE